MQVEHIAGFDHMVESHDPAVYKDVQHNVVPLLGRPDKGAFQWRRFSMVVPGSTSMAMPSSEPEPGLVFPRQPETITGIDLHFNTVVVHTTVFRLSSGPRLLSLVTPAVMAKKEDVLSAPEAQRMPQRNSCIRQAP